MKRKNHNQFIRCPEQIEDLSLQGHYDYALLLSGGLVISRKHIQYLPKTKKFNIINHIDNTKQLLTKAQLMNPKITNIGKAMAKRALIAAID